MKETMVERVDRVIREKVFEVYDIKLLNSPGELGRASIEAMLEPPACVWVAMINTKDNGEGDLHYRKWQAGIDAALGEQA